MESNTGCKYYSYFFELWKSCRLSLDLTAHSSRFDQDSSSSELSVDFQWIIYNMEKIDN